MLSEKERKQVLLSIRRAYAFHPITVDMERQEFRCSAPLWKRILCKISYACFLFQTIFKTLSLAYSLVFKEDETEVVLFMIHLTSVCGLLVASWTYYLLFIRYPEVHAAVVNFSLGPASHQGNK